MNKLNKTEAYLFDTCGLLIRRNAVPPDQIQKAIHILDQKLEPNTWKFPILRFDPLFWDWMTSPNMLGAALTLCGPHVRLDHAFGIKAGHPKVAPSQLHGGPNSSQYSCYYRDIGKEIGLVTHLAAGVVLRGQSPDSGGFCYLPGSHKALNMADGNTIFRDLFQYNDKHPAIIVPTLRPGDMLFFPDSLVHGDTGPRNKDQRLFVYYKFTPGWTCWRDPAQQEEYRKMAPNDLARQLLSPPWVGQYDDQGNTMSIDHVRRKETLS